MDLQIEIGRAPKRAQSKSDNSACNIGRSRFLCHLVARAIPSDGDHANFLR